MKRPVVFARVLSVARVGPRLRLFLDCGHSKLHNPRTGVPRKAACPECERNPE